MSVSNGKTDQTLKLFPSSKSTSMSKASKSSILRKKLLAEKLALELKIAEQKCEEEIRLLRAEAERRAELLQLKRRAEETKLEVAYEDALSIEDSNHGDIDDKDLAGLPVDSVKDRLTRLHLNSASKTQTDVKNKRLVGKESLGEIKPSVKPQTRKPRGENAMCNPPATGSPGDQLFEKMPPAFIKIVRPSVPKFSGDPIEYSKFKAAFKVEVDKKKVYDATEKLQFLLDAVEGSAKPCLAKFMSGSDKYTEAWTAFDEHFGRVDAVVSAVKRRVDQFQVIKKQNSEQIR